MCLFWKSLNYMTIITTSTNFTKFILESAQELTPTRHRAMDGLVGLGFQPAIDGTNPDIDEDTRKTSFIKTPVKLAIELIDGLTARILGQELGERLAINGKIQPFSDNLKKTVAKSLAEIVPNERLSTTPNFIKDCIAEAKRIIPGVKVKDSFVENVKQKVSKVSPETKKFITQSGAVVSTITTLASIFLLDVPFVNKALEMILSKMFPKANDKKEKQL